MLNAERQGRRTPPPPERPRSKDASLDVTKENLKAHRFDMGQFAPHFGTEAVLEDVRRVKKILTEFEANLARLPEAERAQSIDTKALATKCEWTVFNSIHNKKLLGPNVEGNVTALYDDLINGVDQVYHFKGASEEGPSYLGLAIDVTFSHELRKKFDRVAEDIDQGTLSQVKYYKDADGKFRELKNVPRVIVGFDNKRINRIAHAWNTGDDRSPEELFVRAGILREVSTQLEHFAAYARARKQSDIAEVFERNLALIKPAMAGAKIGHQDLLEDKVYAAIQGNLPRFKQG